MIASKLAWPAAGFLAAAGILEAVDVALPDPIVGSAQYDDVVRAGESVLIPWQIEKRTDCPGATSRVWDGAHDFHLTEPQQATSLPKGRSEPRVQTRIPELAPEGSLSLRIIGYFQCEDGRKQPFELGPVFLTVAG